MRQRFDHQQRRRSLRRVGLTQDVFEVPALPRGNRTGGEETNELAVYSRGKILLVFGMQEGIESDQPAERRRGAARFQPMHTQLRSLFLQRFINVIGNHFDGDAGPLCLVHAGANFLGAVAARIPRLEIEVRRGADFQGSEIARRNHAREGGACGHKCDRATFPFGESGKLARQLGHIVKRREWIAGGQPYAAKLAVDNSAVNIRR